MTHAAYHFVAWYAQHGYHVWAELHYYYADHSKGGWVEWLAKR